MPFAFCVIYGVINQRRVFKRGLSKVSDAQSLEVYPGNGNAKYAHPYCQAGALIS